MTESNSATPESRDQSAIIAFLSSPKAFDGQPVKRIDTHISHVFLTGDKSYKLKRAVTFDFLDFSTIAKREEACRREVAINTRFAPALYLGIVPITQTAQGQLSIAGDGQVVDWLVEMVRFDGRQQFDVLARENKLTSEIISGLADTIAGLHRTAPYSLQHGGAQRIRTIADDMQRTLQSVPADQIDDDQIQLWSNRFHQEMGYRTPLLNQRMRHGFIRRCHADLHLANIVLQNGQPTPFDGIEFNDDLCWIDVLYDISFTVMDLLHYDKRRLANLLLNRYLELTRDYAGLAVVPLFISLRAAIRSMAAALGAGDCARDTANQYLGLASNILSRQPASRLIAVSGFSGTGKSTLAKSLAVELVGGAGAVVLSSDAIRKRLCNRPLSDTLGQDAYTKSISDQVYRRILIDGRRALRAGQTVIADATFLDPHWRAALRRLSTDLEVHFTGLWLDAPRTSLKTRLSQRIGDVSDADFSVAERQMATASPPQDWIRVDASAGKAATFAHALDALYG